MAKSKLVEVNEKIAENVVGGYKKIEEGVVGGYKKIEDGAVGGFNKIADKFVDNFLTREGESVEDAKERLTAEQKAREEQQKIKRMSMTILKVFFDDPAEYDMELIKSVIDSTDEDRKSVV